MTANESDQPGPAPPSADGDVAAFYDQRVENRRDLNARSAPGRGPAYHHTGVVRSGERPPSGDDEALAWLYRSEEALTDLVWNLIVGLCPRPPRRLLDAGCGEGATLQRFVELARPEPLETTGITLSEKQADIARRYVPAGRWLVGDMLEEPRLGAGSFDVVLAIESTEYLGPERLPRFMTRASEWLDVGGLLVVVAGSWVEKPANADDYAKLAGFDDHYLTKLSSTRHYRDAAAACGLVPVGELDLAPVTRAYWQIRAETPILQNSKDGLVEKIIALSLGMKKGDFRAYAWLRG